MQEGMVVEVSERNWSRRKFLRAAGGAAFLSGAGSPVFSTRRCGKSAGKNQRYSDHDH